MNVKTCSLRIVVNPQGQPTLQFRARRLIAGPSGLIDAGWYEWESVPVIDDVDFDGNVTFIFDPEQYYEQTYGGNK